MSDPLARLSSQSGGFNPRAVVNLLRKRKWLILGITLAVPALVGVLVSKQPKVYQATASIIIDTAVPQYLGQGFRDVVEGEANWWSSRESLETELRILKSHSNGIAVAKALCDMTFKGAQALHFLQPGQRCGETATYDDASVAIQAAIRVVPVRDSRVVQITAVAGDPAFATLLADTTAKIYVSMSLERRMDRSEGAKDWLEGAYGDMMRQADAAQRELLDFKKKNNLLVVSIEDDANELSNRRKKLAEELNTVDVKLIALSVQRDQLRNLRNGDAGNDLAAAVFENPIVQRLKEQYFEQYGQLSEVQGRYGEKHPMVVAQETRLAHIKAELAKEAELARKQIEIVYERFTRQASLLRSHLDKTTQQALALEEKATEYERLKRELDRLSKLSEVVGGRGQETSLAMRLKTNNVRILDLARMPGGPSAPDVPKAVGLAAVVGLVLAIGLAMLLEAVDSTVKTQDDLEKTVGVTFLGLIPSVVLEDGAAAATTKNGTTVRGSPRDTYVYLNPTSPVAECCRSIRTNLLFMSPDAPARTLLITSAGPQEGKTTVATNMAITLAQSGLRVLLVDTDMRRPRVHKALGLAATSDGISKAIVGECEVSEVIRETGIPNLWVLPCGACPPNPAELLHAERFKRIVEELAASFDRVIFDSPPVGVVTDAAILARVTDGTILVAKAGRTSRDALSRARLQVSGEGVNILGCILNDLDLSKQKQYGYYYYYRYGYYYRAEDAPAAGTGAPPPAA